MPVIVAAAVLFTVAGLAGGATDYVAKVRRRRRRMKARRESIDQFGLALSALGRAIR